MIFDGLFHLSLLDTNVSLSDGGAAVLQEMLDKGNVITVVPVNLRGIELPEGMGSYVPDIQVVTHQLELLLDSTFREGENRFRRGNVMFQAVELDELIEGDGDGEVPYLAGLLFRDGKAVSVTIPHDVVQPELQDIRDAQTEVCFQHKGSCYPVIRSASGEALAHGRDDFFVLFQGQCYCGLVHGRTSCSGK